MHEKVLALKPGVRGRNTEHNRSSNLILRYSDEWVHGLMMLATVNSNFFVSYLGHGVLTARFQPPQVSDDGVNCHFGGVMPVLFCPCDKQWRVVEIGPCITTGVEGHHAHGKKCSSTTIEVTTARHINDLITLSSEACSLQATLQISSSLLRL